MTEYFSKSLFSQSLIPPRLTELVQFRIELVVKSNVTSIYLRNIKLKTKTYPCTFYSHFVLRHLQLPTLLRIFIFDDLMVLLLSFFTKIILVLFYCLWLIWNFFFSAVWILLLLPLNFRCLNNLRKFRFIWLSLSIKSQFLIFRFTLIFEDCWLLIIFY